VSDFSKRAHRRKKTILRGGDEAEWNGEDATMVSSHFNDNDGPITQSSVFSIPLLEGKFSVGVNFFTSNQLPIALAL
jgi:hypothetical protein